MKRIMIQENWDESVQNDVVSLLQKLIPQVVWEHDAQDNNGDSHLKAGIVGPSEGRNDGSRLRLVVNQDD